jgi:hypothetical protein
MIGQLDIYRAGAIFATVDIDSDTKFSEKLPGTDLISCSLKVSTALDLQEGDYIIHNGYPYTINIQPEFGKSSDSLAKTYSISFEAQFYQLLDMYVQNNGAHTFPYYATARDHVQLIVDSANADTSGGWVIGDIDETEPLLLNYEWVYCRTSLDDIASAFGLEWKVKGKTFNMKKAMGRDTGLVFEYGRGKGLHGLTRSSDTTKNVANRVYGVGGTKNITSAYRNGVEPNLVFEERYVETPGVTAGTERVKEARYLNEDIYPHFEGSVTATTLIRGADNAITGFTITDPSIDFDVNTQLQEGVKATVSFLSGQLAGLEFEISNFNYATKTATLIPNTDANGRVLPDDLNLAEAGNKFTFLNIIMPAAYFTAAEAKLKTATLLYRDQNKFQRLIYGAKPDEKHLRDNNILLEAGDRAGLIDSDLEVDEILRFTEISYPLVNPFDVTGTIGNDIVYDRVTKLFADVLNNTQQMAEIDRRGQEIAKRNAQNLRVLAESIFDVEGNFDSAKFNVGVLSALLGIFGIQSANFLLNKVFITGNYGSDPNAVNISAGELFHLEYSNAGNQNIWQMQPVTQNGLTPGQGYYVYSKLSKTSQVGSFLITTDQIKPNDLPGFYTVRTGFIYPQIDGWRDVDFTYGITTVNGRQIKTGEIRGNTNALILNLDTGEIFGKLTFKGSDGTVKDVVTVDNKAALAQANALAAQVLADNANSELADIASDAKLTPNEKVTESRRLAYITQEYPIRIQEAAPYSVSTTAYTSAYNSLLAYINTNGLFTDMTATSDIVANDFKAAFANYYAANVHLTKAISEATTAKINAIDTSGGVGLNYSSGKMLFRDREFANGTNGIAAYNNAGNVSVVVNRRPNTDLSNTVPNNSGFFLQIIPSNTAAPGFGGFYFANQTRANAVFIVRLLASMPVGQVINFASNPYGDGGTFTWNTSNVSVGGWQEFIGTVRCGSTGTFAQTNYFYVTGVLSEFYLASATVYDMTAAEIDYPNDAQAKANAALASANAFADSIAASKANAAQAAAESNASNTAQAKADAAYNAALSASNAYSNNIGSIAAADASNKATAAYNNAQAAADAKYNTLTGSLKSMAYRDIQLAANQGVTTIDNGSVITFSVDAAYVRANVINVGYITGLAANFYQGSIGGILMSSNSIYSSNGTFSVTAAGVLTATQANISGTINASGGTIGGFTIGSNQMTGGGFVLDPLNGQIYFYNNDNGLIMARIGSSITSVPGVSDLASAIFKNKRNFIPGTNVAVSIDCTGAGVDNFAIDILNGNIRVAGSKGFTGYTVFSGNQYDKHISGIYMGRGLGASW